MKLRRSSSIVLFALTTTAFASHPPIKSATIPASAKFYVGAFGGGGSSNHFNAAQLGTAFFIEAEGGPLSVSAFGQLNKQNTSFYGAQLGYQAQEIFLNSTSQWSLSPAVELEGFSTNKNSFSTDLINNTDRLPEHDFVVSYPMRRTMFLANAVLNFNYCRFPFHPYIGFGIGSALVKISNATSTQVSPLEVGINHYNANTSDTNFTFAGQIKPGLSYDVNKYLSFFAEYRWLYLADTHFVLGSTDYPTHAPTSPWQVKLDSQRYNLGSVGVRVNW